MDTITIPGASFPVLARTQVLVVGSGKLVVEPTCVDPANLRPGRL